MKNIKDILFVIQARTQSTRVPNKMLKPFGGSNLFEIAIQKILNSKIIPKDNFYLSVMDDELIEIAKKYKVNYFIYTVIQNLMYCRHVKPDFGKLHEKKDISRISTIGLGNFEEEEKLMFTLDNITETCYIINIEEEDLDNDSQVIPNCQGLVRENKEKGRDTSFAIWRSSEESSFYSLHYTHYIQETIK